MLLVALGWAVFHGQLQFNILVNESSSIQPVWFLMVFVMALLTSSLLEEFEEALKTWLISIVFSIIIVLLLITLLRVYPFNHHWFDTAYGNVFVTDGAYQPDRVFFGPSFEKQACLNLFLVDMASHHVATADVH
jgi:fumarate reductase subunit C